MRELSTRISDLSPEKRRFLEQLLETEGLKVPPVQPLLQDGKPVSDNPVSVRDVVEEVSDRRKMEIDSHQVSFPQNSSSQEIKEKIRQFYNSVNRQLDSTIFGRHSRFLNYGYVADDTPQYAALELPKYTVNRNSVKLVLEVIGDCDLTDRKMLDVGCGRGGTIDVMARYFHPKEIVGIDLSSSAISFCKDNHSYKHVRFQEGDAENLPFEGNSFDVITNIESSHSYPNILAFYMEVFRVLKIGGYFLYTDNLPVDIMHSYLSILQDMGFILEKDRDITNNVLLSCDETASRHLQTFSQDNDPEIMNNFLAVPGSKVYDEMKNRKSTYRIFRFKKKYHRSQSIAG